MNAACLNFNLPNAPAASILQLVQILKSSRKDLAGKAWLALKDGHKLEYFLSYSKSCIRIMDSEKLPSGLVLVEPDRQSEDDFSILKKIAATDPAENADYLTKSSTCEGEKALNLLSKGAVAIRAASGGLYYHRGEQIRARNIKKLKLNHDFDGCEVGQSALFSFWGAGL